MFVEGGHVAGVKPTAAQNVGGGFGLAPVAFHNAVTASDDFADGLAVSGDVIIVGIDDAHFDTGNGIAGHGLPGVTLLTFPTHAELHGRDGESGRSFGEPVAGETFAVKSFFDFANQGRRGRRAADDNTRKTAQIIILALRTIHQDGGHDGHETASIRAFFFDEAENFFGIETLDHDVLAAEKGKEMRNAPAIGVEKRNDVQLDVGIGNFEGHAGVERVEIDVAVREHHTFGIGTGAAGVEEFGDGVFVDGGDVQGVWRGGREQLVVIVRSEPGGFRSAFEQAESFDGGEILAEGVDERKKLLFDEEDGGAGIVEDVAELASRETNVQGEQHGASFKDAVIGFEQAVTIGAEKSDAVTGLNASLAQGTGEMTSAIGELRVGVAVLDADDRRSGGILLLRVAKKAQRSEWNIHCEPRP